MKRKETGITLLSLCVTLIVMIILAGIALRLSIGNDGIIGMTSNTVDQYTNATDQEQEGLNRFVDEFNSILNDRPDSGEGTGDNITIEDSPTITIAGWNTSGGIVELSTQAGYNTEYRIGRTGTWQVYDGQVNVDNGDTIYARYASDEGVSQTVSQIVEDTNGPDVTIANVTVNGSEISITVSAVDHEMGMPTPPTYNYYIKPHNETYYESVGHNETGEFTFTGLQGNTSYDIRVSTTDIAGNQGSATTNSQTGATVEIPTLTPGENIFFDLNPSGPTSGNVDVTIRVEPQLEDPLFLEYSVNGTDNWQRYEGPVEMTDNGRVYAKVTDGEESSNEVYVDVTNIDRTDPDVSGEVQYPTGSDSITVVVTPNDPSDPDNDDFTYDYYIKGEDDEDYRKDETPDNPDGTHTFEGLEQDKEYDIIIVVTDPAGNETTIELPAVPTGTVPSGIEDGNMTLSSNPTTPTNENVTVTITDNLQAGYDIQYSITYSGQSEGPAQNYTGPFEVTDNCTVKAWFTDGTNAGDPATLEIANIDRQAPVASADPESDANKSQEKSVTVRVTETGSAGFNTNQGLNYAWTQSNITVPEGLTSLSGTNADGANEISFTVPSGTGLTGTHYLYVAPVTDRAGNSSEARFFGPYEFDNTVPRPEFEPNGSDEYNKHYDVEITFPDGDGDEVTDIEYEWTKGDEEPTFPEGEDNHVNPGDTIPSPDDATGDDWYLNVKIEDKNGNEEIIKVGPFAIDNDGPSVTYPEGDYTTPKQEHSIKVDVEDPNSGLADDMPKYVWVNGDDTPSDDTLKNGTTFTSGEEIKTPAGETGNNWHLWIYAEDELGNVTKEDIGPFNIDNNPPQVSFSPDGNTDSWEQSYTVTVNPTDGANEAGINEDTLKYQWTQSPTAPDADSFNTNGTPFTPGQEITSPADATGDDWYLWIYVEDEAGNSNIIGTTNPFQIDNTDPTLNLEPVAVEGVSASNTIKVKVTASDGDSGIDEGTYKYYIQEKNGEVQETSNVSKDGDTLTFPNLKADTQYTIYVEVTDNAGNTTTEQITISTGSVAGGDSVIEHNLSEDGWTNRPIDVTLNVADGYDGYTIEYKEPDGDWTEYTGPITVENNETIQVRPVDPNGNRGTESSITITNIDTVSPSLSADPSSVDSAVQSQSIRVTATDTNTDSNIAGFNTGIQLSYGWSTSDSTAPTYDQTATSANSVGATTAEFNITTPNQTGTYYLWISANSFTDRAGNPNPEMHFGPYILDNEGPSIEFTQNEGTNWAKEHTTSVTADDAQEIKYVWKLASEGEPSDIEYTGTTSSGAPITKNTGSGEYILYIKATDSLGNETKVQSGIFRFDNTPADVTLAPSGNSTPAQSHETTVNVSNDILSNIAVQKYIWTTQETGIDESSFASVDDTFTGNGPVRGNGYNGNYYLWIYVEDEAGNTTVIRSETTFNFDNTNPQVTFSPNTNTTPAKSQTTHVNVTDTNLDTSSLKYVWTASSSEPNADQIINPLTNDSDVSINGETGYRYLWVLALDTAGNQVIIGSGAFLVDNNPPSVSLDYEGTTNSITAKVTAEDDYSGIASYEYTLQEVDGDYTRTETSTNPTFTFDNLTANRRYTLTVRVTDGSGNQREVTYQGQISTGTIPGGSGAVTIEPSENGWTNSPITITLRNTSGNTSDYHIVYRVGVDGPETDYTTPFEVSTNTTIYAWLEDSIGNQGSPATAEIARIDTVAPQVTAQPTQDTSSSQTKTITVTATDTNYDSNIAGFNANQSLKYGWSLSDAQEPSSYETMLGTNTAGEQSVSFTLNPTGLNGSYYLWIQANSFEDQAGNTSAVYYSGPYGFDNEVPEITFGPDGSDDYNKHYDVELKFPDGDEDEITNIEYEWTQDPNPPEFTDDGTDVVIGGGEDGKTIIPSPDDATGDDWYLHVKVEDKYGNEDIITVGPFAIDNSGPVITPPQGDFTTPEQSHTVTVDVQDPNSGLASDMPKYVWVNGDGRPTDEQLQGGTTFTPNSPITTPDGETGDNWHLWIYAEDELGNQSVEDIGPFNIDNNNPTVTFEPNGNTGSWNQSYNVTVNPTDGANEAGINEGSLKYQWTQGNTRPDTIATTGTPFTPGQKITSPTDVTGDNWYLWIYVEDNAGNSSIIGTTNPFYIDNTDPELTLQGETLDPSVASNTIGVIANATDADSQINENSYTYYIKQGDGNYGSPVTGEGSSYRFTGLEPNTEYTIQVVVADNAGNTTTKEITITTGSVASGESAITHELNPSTWTNSTVTLTLGLSDDYAGTGYRIQYSESTTGGWTEYTIGGAGITVDTNKTIYARLVDSSGNAGTTVPITITNIDTVAPTISAQPQSESSATQTKRITLTATDTNYDSNVAGFSAGQTIRYGWTTSSTEAPTYDQTASATNSANSRTATFNITTPNYTGDYYLWIQGGSVRDQAGNVNTEAHFGPYTLDNTAPSISFNYNDTNTDYAKSHSVTVNAGDATVRRYVWQTQNSSEPSVGDFTTNFTSGTPIVKNSDSGDWYLWVYVADSLGNYDIQCSQVFRFDNTNPTVTITPTTSPSTPNRSHTATVSIADDGYSRIDTSSLKYLWTTASSGITESSFDSVSDTYTNGGSVQGSGYNGSYYLWVLAKDLAGNTTVQMATSSFNFDNTLPTITITPTSETTPEKSHTAHVNVTDTNLDESSLKFMVTNTNSQPQAESFVDTLSNDSDVTIEEGDGNKYLWVLAIDQAGNQRITGAGPYVLDNTAPTVSLSHTGTSSSITVNVDAEDNLSGVATYQYTINRVGGGYTDTVTDGASHTFSNLTTGTYTVTVVVTDNAGNSASPETTEQITTASIPDADQGAIEISLEPPAGEWTNTSVQVTMTNTVQNQNNLHIEYRIGSTGSYIRYDGPFDMYLNETVYAKLVDDAGNEGNPATVEVANIDKGLPTVTAEQETDTTYTQSKTIVINAQEQGYTGGGISGFNANQSLEYAWTRDPYTAPSSFRTLIGRNTAGAQNISFEVPSDANLTGTYYLWIDEGSLTDRAGNSNEETGFGPYYFDNTAPVLGGNGQITVTNTTSKSISISVPEIVDGASGTPTSPQYTYYIRTGSGAFTQDGNATSSQTHEFTDLDDGTSYEIRVTFTDNSGNIGQVTTTASTEAVPALSSSNTTFTVYAQDGTVLTDDKYTNKAVTVEISVDSGTQAGYTLQYSTNGSTYEPYTGRITVSNENTTVYARLWDERNSTQNVGTATSKTISNIDTSLSDLGVLVKNEDPVTENTEVTDSENNPITIPEGFVPKPDPDSDDPDNPKVEDGVIIEDTNHNQFVWIPVGTINLSTGGTATINYDRSNFPDVSGWVNGGTDSETNSMMIKTTADETEYFVESLNTSEQQSAVSNGGFYLGRYEAGVSGGTARTASSGTSQTVEIKQGLDVYNWVTQSEARSLAENMYSSSSFTSNLTSSYAWDTALRFLQATIGVDADTGNNDYLTNSDEGNYYNTQYGGKSQPNASTLIVTGRTTAVKHLYDMGGNVYEWTIERYSNAEATKVSRGGFYGFLSTDEPVIGRFSSSNTADQAVGFRVALFLGAVDDQVKYMDDLQVGDYVAYTPGSETASSYPLSTAESGYTGYQTISKDSLSWRVLSINDDGTVDLISATPTTQNIYFRGATGYNNGVYLLNDIADELYSNDSLGVTARSLTIEDIEAGMTEAGLEYVHSYANSYAAVGETKTYTSSSYRYYPNIYAQENGSGIDLATTNDPNSAVKTDGIGQSDSYYSEPTTETYTQASSSLTVTQTYYNRLMSSTYYKNSTFYNLVHSGSTYWLASRFVNTYSDYANFGLRRVPSGSLGGNSLFRSDNGMYSLGIRLRPVVSLKSNIRLSSGDGSSSSPYQIAD